jgi:sigma-E factor negative regulatory protein RseB
MNPAHERTAQVIVAMLSLPGRTGPARALPVRSFMLVALGAAIAFAADASAEDATRWLERAAQAAKTLNYAGTIVYQHNGHVETSRLVHMLEGGQEQEKLVSLDGPPREVIRSSAEVRCYFPDAKVIRIEPKTFRNVFPSLSAEQLRTLAQHYDARNVVSERVAGHWTQVMVFEPKDGLRYGHKFWADAITGLLLKARLVDDRGEVVEQFAFTDVAINEKVDREMVKPSWATAPPDWQVKQGSFGEMQPKATGWSVSRLPGGFQKIMEGYRTLRGKRDPVAHLVYSDGLVAISVFVEPISAPSVQTGLAQQGGLNVYTTKQDDYLVTVLGEAPPAAVRQIAQSVAKR